MSDSAAIRNKLYDYIRVADDKKLHAIYNLLENEIEQTTEWWKDKGFVKELDRRFAEMESGKEQGVTLDELEAAARQSYKNRKLKKK